MRPPFVCNREVLGDSMMLRFSTEYADHVHFKGYKREWGLCRGGKTSKELLKDLSQLQGRQNDCILLIGTNDIISGTHSGKQLAKEKKRIKDSLIKLKSKVERKCSRLVWLTVPPIPRLATSGNEEVRRRYEALLSTANGVIARFMSTSMDLHVIDMHKHFVKGKEIRVEYFERWMGNGSRLRCDQIHWNNKGMQVVDSVLRNTFNRYLGTGCTFTELYFIFKLGISTISGIVREVCTSIWNSLLEKEMPTFTQEYWFKQSTEFESNANFPHCLAAK